MWARRAAGERRTTEELRDHYEIERELADRLRNASKAERSTLYASLYDELYRRVPTHPLVMRRSSPGDTARAVASRMLFLERFLRPGIDFLEIGPGDCALSIAVSRDVKEVTAVEVSRAIASGCALPPNVHLVYSDGSSVPVPPESIDVAYSCQVMEHLHPEDAVEQAQNVFRALRRGGVYICITPNRLSGPHDISKYFDRVARGFHLSEYTSAELASMLEGIGFSGVGLYVRYHRRFVRIPLALMRRFESSFETLPYALRRRLAENPVLSGILGIRLVARK
jgi:SAM-dependent methyltransferase